MKARLGEAANVASLTTDRPTQQVLLSRIRIVEGFNPRGRHDLAAFSEERLASLTASIREQGVLQPIWLRQDGDDFTLIAGERRLRAAQLAGLGQIPAVLFGRLSDDEALAYAIRENALRENPSAVDETFAGFLALERYTKLNTDELVRYLNRARKNVQDNDPLGIDAFLRGLFGTGVSTWSQQRAPLLSCTPQELEVIRQGQLDVKAVLRLQAIKDPKAREQMLHAARQNQWSAPQLAAAIREQQRPTDTGLLRETAQLRRDLGKLGKLSGEKAGQARQLIGQLRALISD